MKVEKLISNNQPSDWLDKVTRECQAYPIDMVDMDADELLIDVGSNVGGFLNAWPYRFNRVWVVEPSKYNFEQFYKNIDAKKYAEFRYSRNAVGKKSGEVLKLQKYWAGENDTVSGNFGTQQFVSDNGHGWQGEYEEVIALSFEDVIKGADVGLLKIDCEGAEYDFLMGKDLSKVKWIVGEFHNFLGGVKQMELFTHIKQTHEQIYSEGDGNTSHFVKLFKRK